MPVDHWLKSKIIGDIKTATDGSDRIRDVYKLEDQFNDNELSDGTQIQSIDLGQGSTDITLNINPELFYKVLTQTTGLDIADEQQLMENIIELSKIKAQYMRVKDALDEVEATGYGIVMPTIDQLTLDEPQIIKQSGKYGIKLRASAPSIHMMKIETQTEVTPIVGSEQQSEELVNYLLKEFEESPEKIWESNIFGKSVHELVNEGLHNKLYRMPSDARRKIGETIQKIINDGCNGLICIIL